MSLITHDTIFNFNKLFDDAYSTVYSPYRHAYAQHSANREKRAPSTFSPRVDIIKQDNGYQLIAELPGINKDQVNVTVEESTLTIEANPTEQHSQSNTDNATAHYVRKERAVGKFRRSFDLGQDIELSSITANFNDGLLILDIPKQKEEAIISRKIDIH